MAQAVTRQAGLARRQSVLILCEGFQTEPNYLSSVVRELGLTAVSVPRDHDTDPLNLVRRAIRALKEDKALSRAYVVFDRDNHGNFAAAVACAEQHPLYQARLFIIRSYASFEIWLLMHFERYRAPSTAEQALNRLRQYVPGFEKGDAACMDDLLVRLETAIDNADLALADAVLVQEMNPSTEMQKLVRYLRSLTA